MKLGLVSTIAGAMTFEELIDFARETGLECIEAGSWPKEEAGSGYAVCHVDAERVLEDAAYKEHVISYAKDRGIVLSALTYFANPMNPDPEKQASVVRHLKNMILAAKELGVGLVSTFIGRDQNKSVEENLKSVAAVWDPILECAEKAGVKIAIENCPMLFGAYQWPGGTNLMSTPAIWRQVFEILPSKNLGLNYDPSHFIWQMIDYIKPIYEFKDRIFHVHMKDVKLYKEKLDDVGIMAYPVQYMTAKLPGLGNVDFGKYISALNDIRYEGFACIEVEDEAYQGSPEDVKRAIRISTKYLRNYIL